jgi:hypothetical protein
MSADGHLGSPDPFQRYQQILADFSSMVADSSDIPALLQLTAVQAARGIEKRTSLKRKPCPPTGRAAV